MPNPFKRACLSALFTIIIGPVSWSQQTPAEPISEHSYTAGETFAVAISLKAIAKVDENVIATYKRKDQPNPSEAASIQPPRQYEFYCRGRVNVGQLKFVVNCDTNRKVAGGEYVSDGILTLQRPELGDTVQAPSPTRFPIVTMIENPFENLNLPGVASATLVFSARQALDDASQKSDELLQELSAYYTGQFKDTKETRAYLSAMAERERRIIDNSLISYEAANGFAPTTPEPIVFQDFDRRLRRLLKDLGQTPRQLSLHRKPTHLLLVSAQIPSRHESLTVEPQAGRINKSAEDLAGILSDAVRGFLGMKNSGAIVFTWSLTTDPKGARVYITRMDEPESQLAGVTNMIDQKLDYARWKFRIEWDGCSRYQDVNPFLQSDIKITVTKVGCKAK